MEQNIADLLKDAFSEVDIDFEHLQLDEGTNMSETQLLSDDDDDDDDDEVDLKEASKLWASSDPGSAKPVTDVYEQEDDEETSDNSEDSESSNPFKINTESAVSVSYVTDFDQCVENIMTETQQTNQTAEGCTAEEGNMQRNLEESDSKHGLVAGVSMISNEELRVENAINSSDSSESEENPESAEYQILIEQTYSVSIESQTPEETSSGSGEEEPEISSAEQPCPTESDGNKDNHFGTEKPSDLREFTEEDQEQIEESLADYPSDLSYSESEECQEGTNEPLSSQEQSSFSIAVKDLSSDEEQNLQDEDHPIDHSADSTGINVLQVETLSETADVDLSKRENFEGVLQESLKNDINPNEDIKFKEDSGDDNDQADYDSDMSSDDNSTSQLFPSMNNEGGWTSKQHDYTTGDLMRVDDHDYTYPDTEDTDGSSRETENAACLSVGQPVLEEECTNPSSISCYEKASNQSTELYPNIESIQPDATMRDHTEASNTIRDTKTLISDALWSSELLMDEDNLTFDKYDWSLTGEELFENLGEGENLENADETLEDLYSFDDKEENERNWEQEKSRIEAFYRFYGDQDEKEDQIGRNPKVTFRLDQESSEYEDDSESSEEELDNDSNMPVQTVKPQYHSDSDEALEKPFSHKKSKKKPRVLKTTSAAQLPPRNRCLSVLKSTLALGLVTAIGVISFWLATENLEWIY